MRARTAARARRLGVILCAGSSLAACSRDVPPREWVEEDGYRWRPLTVRGRAAGFSHLDAERAGISFRYEIPEAVRLENRILVEGGGVALGDVDRDGLPDLFFAGVAGQSALYRNLGRWRFADVTRAVGLRLEGVAARGAAFADVDGDGDLDLVVTVHGDRNRLFMNDGAGVFTERSDAGFEAAAGSTTPTLADVDADGDLDLYVANYKIRQADDLFSPVQRSFDRLRPDETGTVRLPPDLEGHYRIEVEGTVVRRWELGEVDEFYLNDGSGRFERVGFTDGRFLDEEGDPLATAPRDWGLSASFHDWDLDGDADLYVANDFSSPDHAWLNIGDGAFRAVPTRAIRTTSLSSMTIEFSDLDRDGDVDLLTTDMLARDRVRRLMQVPSVMPNPVAPGEIDPRPQVNRNTLQLNRGDGTFAEAAWAAGIAASDWTWGALFLDVDLDGYEDMLVTTGHVWDQLDADTHARLRAAPGTVDWRRELGAFPRLPQRNAAFRNRGDATFEDVSEAWGFGAQADISHGIAAADLDGDGDRDVVVTRYGDPPALYRNESGAPRVAVRLTGEPPNTGGVGARVHLLGQTVGDQSTEVSAGGLYLSSSDGSVTFAAGEDGPFELIVEWPHGSRTRIPDVRANRLYEVAQGGEADPGRPRPSPESAITHFADVSATLGHVHVETPFDDALRQPLLPNRLSQLGPGLTWLDADADGDPDLFIPDGRGGRLAYYRNEAGELERVMSARRDAAWGDAAWDQTAVLGLPVTADTPAAGGRSGGPGAAGTGGRQDLLVGQMSYEARSPAEAFEIPSVVRLSLDAGGAPAGSARAAVSGDRSAIGPMAQADVDGDGDLDLFVGGRVIPVAYPIAATSRLLRNEGGHLVHDSALSAPFVDVGLVSAAVFSDLDLDGDPDLALATEWGPVRVFRNEAGAFPDATAELGLADLVGRWNGLAAGDLNADGYPDLVVTGWGGNTEHAEHADRYTLVYGDLDRNGTLDLVEAEAVEGGALRPLARLDQLGRGIPFLQRRPGGHRAFATASLQDLFGEALARSRRLETRTLRHALLLNRRTHFEAVPLPFEAQLAPALGVGVSDLDGDGLEDIFLGQNFFPVRRGTPRYDAGRGVWLRGDGRGGLTPIPGHVSGIAVYGDARGAAFADYDRDGRVDLAVAQNGAATVLYRNLGAKPGIRVRLAGPPGNPQAIGAGLQLVYEDGPGPLREVRSGGGYWSRDEAVQTMGMRVRPLTLRVRWPGGQMTEEGIPPEVAELGGFELRVEAPGGGATRP